MAVYEKELPVGQESDKKTHDRIRKTLDYMIKEVHPKWRQHMCMYEGDHWGAFERKYHELEVSAQKPRENITVNQAGVAADRMLAYLLGGDFKILLDPRRPQDFTPAMLQEMAINDIWARDHCIEQIRRAGLYAEVTGRGWVKIWMRKSVSDSEVDEDGNALSYEDFIREEEVYIEAISPFHMLWDLQSPTGKPDSSRYMGQIFFKAPEDVLENQNYDPSVLAKINRKDPRYSPTAAGDVSTYTSTSPFRFGAKIEEDTRWMLVEWYDKKFRTRKTYCIGVEEPLRPAEPWNNAMKTFPYVWFDYRDSLYTQFPISIMKWIEDAQYELDRSRTLMFMHRRKNLGGRYQISDAVDEKEIVKWENGGGTLTTPQPLEQQVRPLPYTEIPKDEFSVSGLIQNDINEMTYINDLLRGAAMGDRTTASEVAARSQFSMQPIDQIKDNFQRSIKRVIRQMIDNMKAFYDKERIIRIAGPVGDYWGEILSDPRTMVTPDGKYWIPYTKDDIDAECDIDIQLTPLPKADPMAERQQDISEFQMLLNPQIVPIMQSAGFDYVGYIKAYFEKYGKKDAVRYLHSLSTAEPPVPAQQTGYDAMQQQQTQPPGMMPPPVPSTPPPGNPQVAALQQQAVNPMSELQGAMGALGPMGPPMPPGMGGGD